MHKSRRRQFAGFIVVIAALACSACDGVIQVRGRVYTQRKPSGQSRLFVGQIPDDDLSDLLPVEGATVTAYYGGDYAKDPINASTSMKDSIRTDASGRFSVGGVCAPSKFHAALVVEKLGFQPVTQVFLHEGTDHDVIAILVPAQASGTASTPVTQPN